jgi:hypothetical protein
MRATAKDRVRRRLILVAIVEYGGITMLTLELDKMLGMISKHSGMAVVGERSVSVGNRFFNSSNCAHVFLMKLRRPPM